MRRALAIASLLALWAGGAAAHETWLATIPTAPSGVVRVGMTSGMTFPAPETGPKADRMGVLKATIGGAAARPKISGQNTKVLILDVPTGGRRGLMVVDASLKPRDIDLNAKQVIEYFDEVHPPADIRAAWAKTTPQVWRETYVKNARLIACVADCGADRSAMTASGANLEFVALEPGPSPTRFRLLAGGRPAAGLAVSLAGAKAFTVYLKTDANGEVRAPGSAGGWMMLSAVWLRPPGNPGQRFTSDFASVVFGGK